MDDQTSVFSARIQIFGGRCRHCGHKEMMYVGVCEENNCRNTELADNEKAITELTAMHSATHLPVGREVVGLETATFDLVDEKDVRKSN